MWLPVLAKLPLWGGFAALVGAMSGRLGLGRQHQRPASQWSLQGADAVCVGGL